MLCKYDNGQGSRHALISASRYDDNGHRTAVHTRIRACGGSRLRHVMNIVSEVFQKQFPHPRAVIVFQPFFGNGGVVFDLAFERLAHVVNFRLVGKRQNVCDAEQIVFGTAGSLVGACATVQNGLSVFFDAHHVGMMPHDAHARRMPARIYANKNIENTARIGLRNAEFSRMQIMPNAFQVGAARARNAFEFFIGVARYDPRGSSGVYPFQTVGMRNDHPFHVFEDIPADRNFHAFRKLAERVARKRRRIRYGNRFGTAERRQQLGFENIHVTVVNAFIHNKPRELRLIRNARAYSHYIIYDTKTQAPQRCKYRNTIGQWTCKERSDGIANRCARTEKPRLLRRKATPQSVPPCKVGRTFKKPRRANALRGFLKLMRDFDTKIPNRSI